MKSRCCGKMLGTSKRVVGVRDEDGNITREAWWMCSVCGRQYSQRLRKSKKQDNKHE